MPLPPPASPAGPPRRARRVVALAGLALVAIAALLLLAPGRERASDVAARAAAHAALPAAQATPELSQSGSTIRRRTGGVVMELGAIPELEGAELDELHLYRWDAQTEALVPAPFQIDERIAGGRYVLVERSGGEGVDANDELVALVRHLGGRAPVCAWPQALPETASRWDLEVRDPLDPEGLGWLHLFRHAGRPQAVPTLIAWDRQAREMSSIDFRLVQARRFVGLETLELFGSGLDILDRSKVRADVYVQASIDLPGPLPDPTFVFDEEYTEESPEVQREASDFVFSPVKQGPVRLVLEPDGEGFAYPGQVQLFAAFGRIDLPRLPREVMELIDKVELLFRVSLDFTEEATPGRYADSNVPEGVPIDGSHDNVPEQPISDWRQVDTPSGGLVLATGKRAALRQLATYYNDRGRDEPPGTGDNKSYGENGVFAEDIDAVESVTNFIGWLVVLPPGAEVQGERVLAEVENPVTVHPIAVGPEECVRATDTPPPSATPTETREPTPTTGPSRTPTPPPTPTPSTFRLHLPWAADEALPADGAEPPAR